MRTSTNFLSPPPGETLPVVSYARASLDRRGEASSVRSQQFERERFLETRPSWELLASYGDNSKSAAKTTVVRDDFERMLADIETGVVQPKLILVLDLSRLFRNRRDKERMLKLMNAGVHIYDMRFGFCTADQPAGRIIFEIMSELAIDRAEELAEHQRRHADREKAAGNPPLTGRIGFGHRRVQTTNERGELVYALEIVEQEAKAIRWATEQIIAGESWNSCVVEWANCKSPYHVKTRAGGEWHLTTMKQILLSPRIAGCRELTKKDAYGNELKELVPNRDGRLPAIITVDQLLQLRELSKLQNLRYAAGGGVRRGEEKHLASGLATCGLCGKRRVNAFRATSKSTNGTVHRPWCYRCAECTGISIIESFVDEFLKHAVIECVRSGAIARAVAELAGASGASELAGELALEQDRLREFVELNRKTPVSPAAYVEFVTEAERRIENAQRRLTLRLKSDRSRFASTLPANIADVVEDLWNAPETKLAWKRRLMDLCLEEIVILPAPRGKRDLAKRLQITPRTSFKTFE